MKSSKYGVGIDQHVTNLTEKLHSSFIVAVNLQQTLELELDLNFPPE